MDAVISGAVLVFVPVVASAIAMVAGLFVALYIVNLLRRVLTNL